MTEVHKLLEKPFVELVGHLPSKSGQVAGGCAAGEAHSSDGQLEGAGRGPSDSGGPSETRGAGVRALVTMAIATAAALAGCENGCREGLCQGRDQFQPKSFLFSGKVFPAVIL